MAKQFTRVDEDFICGHCGRPVEGNGYTNHCPLCLYSKHVDDFPGDRSAECGGMMRPVGLIVRSGKEDIIHKCEVCGKKKINKVQEGDDRDSIIKLSTQTNG